MGLGFNPNPNSGLRSKAKKINEISKEQTSNKTPDIDKNAFSNTKEGEVPRNRFKVEKLVIRKRHSLKRGNGVALSFSRSSGACVLENKFLGKRAEKVGYARRDVEYTQHEFSRVERKESEGFRFLQG